MARAAGEPDPTAALDDFDSRGLRTKLLIATAIYPLFWIQGSTLWRVVPAVILIIGWLLWAYYTRAQQDLWAYREARDRRRRGA